MRILISAVRFEPEKTLGSEIFLKSFLESLPKVLDKEKVAVVGSEKTRAWGEKFANQLHWIAYPLPDSSVRRMFFEEKNIESIARKWNADVVYFPFNIMPKIKTRGVLLLHDLVNEFYCKKFPLYRPFYYRYVRRLVRRAVKNADSIITISNAVANELKNSNLIGENEKPIRVALLGAGEKFEKIRKPKFLPDNNKKIILQPGAQLPHKSHITGIKAMAEVRKEHPKLFKQLQLVLTGGANTDRKSLDFIRESGISESIIFLGRLEYDELEWTMQNSEIVCFPTLYEGFGLGLVEAQKRQIPVIASDIPVFKEVSAGGTVFFEPENEKDLARKIIETVQKPNGNRLKEIHKVNGGDDKLDWKIHCGKVLEILTDTADNKSFFPKVKLRANQKKIN